MMKVGTLKKILEKIPDDYEFVIDDAYTGWIIKPEGISIIDEEKLAYPKYCYMDEMIETPNYYLIPRTLKGDEDDHTTN